MSAQQLVAYHDIAQRVVDDVPHMQDTRRVGVHVEYVAFLARVRLVGGKQGLCLP